MNRAVLSRIGVPRTSSIATPAIVIGALTLSLGLTAASDTRAQTDSQSTATRSRLVAERQSPELRILDWSLWHVSRYYVEPDRINPRTMTLAGLEALEQSIPEVLVEPTGDGKQVRMRVGTAEREFPLADVELWAVTPHIQEVMEFIGENTTLTAEDQRQAEYAVVAGILGTLDPHTNLLRPEDFEDMKASTTGSFGGLGIEVGMRDGFITVIRVIDGNPASRVDMQPGDRIVQIDDQSTVTMTLNESVGLLRGPPGTLVSVHIMREGLAKPKKLDITRATIQLDSVVGDVLHSRDANGRERKVGVARLQRNFAQTTGRELREKLAEFEKAGVDGVVLDLRDNPGGLLNAAVEVADAFLSSGTIVATVGSNPTDREENNADSRYDFPNLPLVVLVDQASASASEIVAGALRNLGRAVVLGRRTFGKGSVQVLHERRVDDKELALKLTIAQYLTPGDVSIQSVGVSPDLETIPVYVGNEHVQYFGRDRFDMLREESLAAHLVGNATPPHENVKFGPLHFLEQGSIHAKNQKTLAETLAVDPRSKELLEDPEIRIANSLILWAPAPDRATLLSKIDAFLAEQTKQEEALILESLGRRGVDWTPGPAPVEGKHPRLRVSMKMDKSGNMINAGETGRVTVTVSNDGSATAYQVRAITDSDNRYFDERELFFGRIDPGKSAEYAVKLSVSEHELSRTDRIDLHLYEQHGAKLGPDSQTSLDVHAQGLPRPKFAYGYQILDAPRHGKGLRGNGDGHLQVGERVQLRVHVNNQGNGPALDTWVTLRNLSDEAIFLHSGRAQLSTLAPGAGATADLEFEVKQQPPRGTAKLQLSVSDNKIAEFLSEKLVLDIAESGATAEDGGFLVKTTTAVDLYGAAPGQRLIARSTPGSVFKVTGQFGEWMRLELEKQEVAFVRESAVSRTKGSVRPRVVRVLGVSPPTITLMGDVTQTDSESIHVSGVATDETAVRDVYITVYNPSRDWMGGRDKVFYQAAANPEGGQLEFAADIPLTPGNNLVEVHARENDDVVGTTRMWVLRTSGLAEARAKEATLKSSGGLRVDTLQ